MSEAGRILRANRGALLDCLRADGLSTALAQYYGAWILRQAEPALLEHAADELLRSTPASRETLVRRPDGVVALITPGNSPTINTAPLFSILLAGNGVLMRAPARDTGARLIAGTCIAAALGEAGFSRDLVQVVTGRTRPLLEEIYASADVDTIVFFGNAKAGSDVAERGHAAGKKVVLELEGSDCMVLWSDADLEGALASAARGFDFSTQPCPIPKHFLVHEAIAPAFIAGLERIATSLRTVEADPEDGPLVPLARPENFDALVSAASTLGEVITGGERMDGSGRPCPSGAYGQPTLVVIDHPTPDPQALLQNPLFEREINTPVLPVIRFAGDDAGVLSAMLDTIAAVPFGLRASLWTEDQDVAKEFLRRLGDVGLLMVNTDHAHHPAFLSPWGGPKRSGGPHGENHQFWQKTSHLQGVVAAPAIVRAALLGRSHKLTLERRGAFAWLTLNRPERHNAVDRGLAEALDEALDEVAESAREGELRGVVLRGAGPSFCSGADLDMLRHFSPRAARQFMQVVTWNLRQLERLPVPSLALVHGACVGGGLEFVLHCDAIIAADDTRFGLPEVRHGLGTTAGAVGRLVRAIGRRRAADWLLSGQPIDAARADAAGLLTATVPAAELEQAGTRWCANIESLPPEGLSSTRRTLAILDHPDTWTDELESFSALLEARHRGRV